MDAAFRMAVRERALFRCEYCGIREEDEPFYTFHLEHVIARQHGGADGLENRALACRHCNFHKGPNLSGIDPLTGAVVRLYDPRTQHWHEHFEDEDRLIDGLTPIGRATVQTLAMNDRLRLESRRLSNDG